MRLRTTAPPNAFLMLKPNRLRASSFERTKTVKCVLERRFPARYTVSNAPRRSSRASRGNVNATAGPSLFRCEAMTSLLAARRKHFAATRCFHAGTKPVCFGPAAAPRLKRTLWQSIPLEVTLRIGVKLLHPDLQAHATLVLSRTGEVRRRISPDTFSSMCRLRSFDHPHRMGSGSQTRPGNLPRNPIASHTTFGII